MDIEKPDSPRSTKPANPLSRREFAKGVAYVAPLILTLKAVPAFAQVGSNRPPNGGTNGPDGGTNCTNGGGANGPNGGLTDPMAALTDAGAGLTDPTAH